MKNDFFSLLLVSHTINANEKSHGGIKWKNRLREYSSLMAPVAVLYFPFILPPTLKCTRRLLIVFWINFPVAHIHSTCTRSRKNQMWKAAKNESRVSLLLFFPIFHLFHLLSTEMWICTQTILEIWLNIKVKMSKTFVCSCLFSR